MKSLIYYKEATIYSIYSYKWRYWPVIVGWVVNILLYLADKVQLLAPKIRGVYPCYIKGWDKELRTYKYGRPLPWSVVKKSFERK